MGRVFIAELEKRHGRNYLNKDWGDWKVCVWRVGGKG